MKQQNKFTMHLTDNVRVVPDDEIEYCSATEFFAQMDECNKRAQRALNECLNIGEGAL